MFLTNHYILNWIYKCFCYFIDTIIGYNHWLKQSLLKIAPNSTLVSLISASLFTLPFAALE